MTILLYPTRKIFSIFVCFQFNKIFYFEKIKKDKIEIKVSEKNNKGSDINIR